MGPTSPVLLLTYLLAQVVVDLTQEEDSKPHVRSNGIEIGTDMLAALRRLTHTYSPTWASGSWAFNIRGTECCCSLLALGLTVADVQSNPASLPGAPLYERFSAAHTLARDKRVTLGFHGTPPENLWPICNQGLDPGRRGLNGQAMGVGEYFATQAQTSIGYCRPEPTASTWRVLLFALLEDAGGISARRGDVIVVHRQDHQLPLCIVSFVLQ